MEKRKASSDGQIFGMDLKLQSDMIRTSRARKVSAYCALAASASFLLLFCALFFIMPKKSFSENENRTLASASSISASSILEGSFPEKIRTLISDQFPFRDAFFGAQSYISLAFTGEANGVTLTQDSSLSKDLTPDKQKLEMLDTSLDSMQELERAFLSKLGIKSSFAIVPLPCRAYQNRRTDCDFGFEALEEKLKNEDLFDFSIRTSNTNGIFYKTDHHLNADGTYLLYLFVCEQLKIEPKTDFTKVCVSDQFYGTTWSQSGLWATPPDKIYKLSYESDKSYRISGDITSESLYFPEKLETKDKYAYFLGGNYGRIEINSVSCEKRPRLLLVKDSYANSLVPLLARHFDITMIDPRYYNGDIMSDAQSCECCLFLFGISSLMTDIGLVKLSFNANQ